ncbi:hypothetical protein AD940_00415, partial [Gluconobacter thailandicus]|uniref:hypothetical protein n=1 Tax=Gluconobacter thailandicus TaxID=257438 RepID=UPI000777AE4B
MAEKRLKASIIIGGLLDGSLRSAFTGTQSGFRRIGAAVKDANRDARRMRDEIKSLDAAGKPIDRLTGQYNVLTRAIERAESAAKRIRVTEARAMRVGEHGAGLRSRALGVGATGAGVAAGFVAPIRQAETSQVIDVKAQSIGLKESDVKGALDFARRQNIFGVSKNEMSEMMSDLLGAFGERDAAEHAIPTLARMKFAYTTRYGASPEDAERQAVTAGRVIDARGGAKSKTVFDTQADYLNREVQATSGGVTPEMLRQIQTHGGAAAFSSSDKGIYYHAASLANETQDAAGVGTGMLAAYQNLYQGKTSKRAVLNMGRLGLIGDPSKVRYDKTGQQAQLNPGALLGADVFRRDQFEWVTKVLIPQLAKRGITDEKGITDAISSIVTNSQGAKILTAFFLNMRQIKRDEENATKSPTIVQAATAAQGTAKGQQIGITAKTHDLELSVGLKLLPVYTSVLKSTNDALDKLNSFTERHPTLARNMALGIAGVTAGLLVAAPAMVVAGAALNAYSGFALMAARREAILTAAMLKNTAATEAQAVAQAEADAVTGASMMQFSGRGRIFRPVGAALSMFPRGIKAAGLGIVGFGKGIVKAITNPAAAMRSVFAGLRAGVSVAFSGIGTAIRGVGLAFGALLSPVGVAVLAIGAAAALIYKYWEPIKTFFGGVWKGIQEGLGPLGPGITAAFSPIVSVVKSVWGWFTNLLQPVHLTKDGVEKATSSGEAFGKIVGSAIKGVVGWLEKAVGYFTWIGQHGASIFHSVTSGASGVWNLIAGSKDNQDGHAPVVDRDELPSPHVNVLAPKPDVPVVNVPRPVVRMPPVNVVVPPAQVPA